MSILPGMATAAKDYARRGWRVVPLHGHNAGICTCRAKGNCDKPGKHPRLSAWQNKATTDEQTIEQWLKQWPVLNLGVRLGPESNLVDVEYDDAEGEATAQELLSDIVTPTYRSHRSQHRLYSFPTRLAIPKAVVIARGLELRFGTGERGAQSVVPPSTHASGTRYEWLEGLSPSDVALASFPEALVSLVESPATANNNGSGLGFIMGGDDNSDTLETHPGASDGSRNDELCRLIGRHIKAQGITADLPKFALAWGKRCQPPMDENRILKSVTAIVSKEQEKGIQASQSVGVSKATAVLVVRRGDEIRPEEVQWLWPGRIPVGKLSLLVGQGEAGKTFVSCDIMARLSRGVAFPDGEGEPGHSLIATAEDGLGDTIRPRLDDLGADPKKWFAIELVKHGEKVTALSLDRHVEILDAYLEQHPEVRLLVIDPLAAYLGKVNSHSDAEVRTVLSPLCKLAECRRVAVLGIMHLTKSEERKVQQRVSGSIAFINAARTAWLVAKDPDDADDNKRLFLRVKGNLKGVANTGLSFTLEDGRVVWGDEPVFVTAGDIDDEKPSGDKRKEAADFLAEFLAKGERLAADVYSEAGRRDISKRTLDRAKRERVETFRHNVPGPWYWRLVDDGDEAETPPTKMVFD